MKCINFRMNLSWANQIAKAALKTAQQKIDTVLDIRTDDDSEQATSVSFIFVLSICLLRVLCLTTRY